jgi:UMF1 family MFS transporter
MAQAFDDKREIFGWSMYDWANSAFATSVVAVFAGPYLSGVAKAAADATGQIYLLGLPVRYDSFFFYCVSASVFCQALVLPVLGAIADYSHARKKMMMLFTAIGGVTTGLLAFVTPGWHWLGAVFLILANLAFGASISLYNSFLPDIASPRMRDRVSSRGFALGYLGGAILLLLNLLLFAFKDGLGLDRASAARISLASAAAWWLGFSSITFRTLQSRQARSALPAGQGLVSIGFRQLAATFRDMRRIPQTARYLAAYFLYNDGIQTVMLVATMFAEKELEMSDTHRILLILMIQIVAFFGARFYGWLAERIGTQRAILSSLVVWCGVVVYAFVGMTDPTLVNGLNVPTRVVQFWILGAVVAIVLGGSQALSRSLFSRMIPKGKEAEFFAFYEVSDRGSSWIGTLVFGIVNQVFHSLRTGILALIVLFVAGLAILATVDVRRAADDAERIEPAGRT